VSTGWTIRRLSLAEIGLAELVAWQELAVHAGEEANVFLEPWFLQTALAQFDPDGQAQLLVAEDSDGVWHGLIVVARTAFLGRMPLMGLRSWSHANQFLGTPLLRKDSEETCWRLFLGALDAASTKRIALTISDAPADDPAVGALQRVCTASKRPFRIVSRDQRPMLQAAQDTRQLLSPKRSARLRRQAAKLDAAHGCAFETLTGASDVAAWTDEFLALERSGWKGAAGSALGCDPRTTAMFRAAMHEGFETGRLRAHKLCAAGRVIAMTTYFVRGGRAYGFKACYDEAFAAYAPGLLLIQEVMRVVNGPVVFDSCANADQGALNDMWAERREILDICVALGQRRRWIYGATMAALGIWRSLKASATKAASRSPA